MIKEIWFSIHLIGLVIGAGSITTAYVRDLYFKWHPEFSNKKGSLFIIPLMLNISFVLLIISGFGLYLQSPQEYNQSPAFLIKMFFAALLLGNHLLINAYLRPNREKFKTIYNFSEYFSLLGWYFIIIISVFI